MALIRGEIVGTKAWRASSEQLGGPMSLPMIFIGPMWGGVIYLGYQCAGAPADMQVGFTAATENSSDPLLTWPVSPISGPNAVLLLAIDWPPQQTGVLTLTCQPGSTPFPPSARIMGTMVILPSQD